jgi:hypothetical protein
MNYIPPFTGDEIQEGKKCLLNGWRKPQSMLPVVQTVKGKHATGATFSLNVQALEEKKGDEVEEKDETHEEEKVLEPQTRAAGGVWLLASDFPHCFQHFVVYHNFKKYEQTEEFKSLWTDP